LDWEPAALSAPIASSATFHAPSAGPSSGIPKPAVKVAGVRQKKVTYVDSAKKGKKKAGADPDADKNDQAKRGRPSGSRNFSNADTWALLDAVDKELPIGERGWIAVAVNYNVYAREHRRPPRKHKSLENKFKQVCHHAINLVTYYY
jgi:hypothetical protein